MRSTHARPTSLCASLRAMVLLGTASLAACATESAPLTTTGASDATLRGEVDQQLAQSAAQAANALQTLAMIQRTRSAPTPSSIDETGLPAELRRPATLAWSGPAREAVRSLAAEIGYGFIETGAPPQKPVLVNLDIRGVSAAKGFETIGLEVQAFATVIVDPNLRRVEFRNENAEARPMGAPPLGGAAGAKKPGARHETLRHAAPAAASSSGAWHPSAMMPASHGTCLPVTCPTPAPQASAATPAVTP